MASKDAPKPAPPASAKDGPKKGKDGKKPAAEPMVRNKGCGRTETEQTEEDIKKKAEMDLLAERLLDPEPGVQKLALETVRHEIRTATSSMTSIPKPLKFMRPHYTKLKEAFEKLTDADNKRSFADILAVLGMTYFASGQRDCLHYKLKGNPTDIAPWGHEFVRYEIIRVPPRMLTRKSALAAEVAQEFSIRREAKQPVDDLLNLVGEIIPFDVSHHAEPDACDLLMEVEQLPKIIEFADRSNYTRICLYLISCANYVAEPEDSDILNVVVKIYRKLNDSAAALRIALRLGDLALIKEVFAAVTEPAERKQLAFQLARHNTSFEVADAEASELVSNVKLHEYYQALARELEVVEAKTPDDIYKQHLVESRAAVPVDSARQNLASTFVNAFVNVGFQADKLMVVDESNKWLYKNKEHGMMSAAASLGMILMWDVEGGIGKVDKFLYSREDYVKAGALLAIGMLSTGVRNELEPAMGLLSEHVDSPTEVMRTGAILGLGLAYAGTAREDLVALLTPVLEDTRIELSAYAALALGLVFVGTAHTGITGAIVQVFFERDDEALSSPFARFFALGLGLLYLGRQQVAEVTLETLRALENKPFAKYASLTVDTCAYAGSGNVERVQKMLAVCGEHPEKEAAHQAVAVLGIALVAMGEELGSAMAQRSFEHLMQYGEPAVRRAVPLAIGMLSIADPAVTVTDSLSKMSHDPDEDVATSAVLALGLIGAGTNNARIAGLLRQLSAYYGKNQQVLFVVRIAQGLLHLGKGLVTLSPWHSERLLLKPAALGGLLAVLHSCLDMKNLILGKAHYLLYMLAPAITPRCLMTFDENLQAIKTPVRVGQAVDTVGQAGKPKTITGFQTLNTPVLLGHGERAELATDEYIPLSPVLEGFVILRVNPNSTYKPEPKNKKDATKEKLLEDVARFKPAAAVPKAAPAAPATK